MTDEALHGNMTITDKVRASAARTVSLMARRKNLNDDIKEEREQMEKIGVHPRAYQDEIRNFKLYTEGERADYMASRETMQEALTGQERTLFGEAEVEARNKRAAKRAAKVAEIAGASTADNPRGDPKKGGAGGVDGKKKAKDAKPKAVEPKVTGRRGKAKGGDNAVPIKAKASDRPPDEEPPTIGDPPPEEHQETGDEMIARVSREKMAELEQREGGKVFDDALDRINGAGTPPVDNDGDKVPGTDAGEGFAPPPLN